MKTHLAIFLFLCLSVLSCSKDSSSSTDSGSSSSSNGSLTRFITYANSLYIIDRQNLNVYSISTPASPVFKKSVSVGFNIETIFVYQDKLFIGSNNSIFIYSVSSPDNPALVSRFDYFIPGRDPVVVQDSVAYSTTRNFGTNAGGNLNIVNIKNLSSPISMGTLNLRNPYGLAINGNALYVCEGAFGLKVFNRTNPYTPVLAKSIDSLNETFYDIIVQGDLMFCYVKAGIMVFDVTDVQNPIFVSRLKN